MARRPAKRQCNLCGRFSPGGEKQCPFCGTALVQRRWRMTAGRIQYVHTIAYVRKGLTPEEYKDRLLAITGRTTSKALKRAEFARFMADIKKLPDVPAVKRRRAA